MNIFLEITNVNIIENAPVGEGIHIIFACCLVLAIVKILNIIWKKKRINQMNNFE